MRVCAYLHYPRQRQAQLHEREAMNGILTTAICRRRHFGLSSHSIGMKNPLVTPIANASLSSCGRSDFHRTIIIEPNISYNLTLPS